MNEDVDTQPDEILREASKFVGLMEAFDIKSGAEMEENLLKNKQEILSDLQIINDKPEILTTSLIESDELLSDFVLVRNALRDDISSTRVLLKKLSDDLSASHSDDISGYILLSYAELKKGNVTSMKLLMDSYSTVAETQIKVKKLITEIKSMDDKEDGEKGTVNIQNNFIGSTVEMLKMLKEK